jgi:branched-chain amino acid transport system ATP-binding protein
VTTLDVRDVGVDIDGNRLLHDVTLRVEPDEWLAVIGPNGAGKSTLVNTLAGIVRPFAGRYEVRGRIAVVPEGREVFPDLSVDDNLRLGGWRNGRRGRDTSAIYELLPDLVRVRRQKAGLLSGGQQQMVSVGRALMGRPDVLVVDELSLGLAPLVVADLVTHLRELNASRGIAVLLIEQNARLALELCTRAYVLEAGRIVLHGPSAELAGSDQVAAAYLGGATT